ncbi:MAG: DUF547 domain-containing protein [Rhodoferax sp.]|nr:DUF547 domain-containing protein [Rhodoferax sp.]
MVSIAACAILTRVGGTFGQISGTFDHQYAAWDVLLKKHVRWLSDNKQSRVNYKAFAADKAEFKKVLDAFSAVPRADFDKWTREQQMVFLTNAYNAFTIQHILSKYPDLKSIKDLGSLIQSAWKKKFFTLLGEERHLDWIEHEQLRPRYNEPRIHVAVNCASIGCPALPPEAFTPARFDTQLEEGMVRFLGDRTRNRMADGKLEVSQIFKWFREDFEKGNKGFSKLEDVFAKYAEQLADVSADREKIKAKSVSITHLDYDWSLNDLGR